MIGALTQPGDVARLRERDRPLHAAARAAGCSGQTFEIEVAAGTRAGRPVFTRGYVTITSLVTPDDPQALHDWFDALEDGLARYGDDEPRAVPEGAEPLVGFDLTTHAGHFMGSGHNRLRALHARRARPGCAPPARGTRCRGTSTRPTSVAGSEAQHAFWGQGDDAPLSMLHQLAPSVAA